MATIKINTGKGHRRKGLLTFAQVAPWQRDNEYILTNYRPASNSTSGSLTSILAFHNETTNIWSHLLGAVWFLAGLVHFYTSVIADRPLIRAVDAMLVGLYYLCVAVCFLLSTFFHTFSDHSPGVHKLGNELDHLGIVLVMWGSGVSSTYFGFYCDQTLRNAYIAAITTTALGCALFTLQSTFRQPSYRTVRFLMYCFLGSSLFAPCIHGLQLYGWELLDIRMSLSYFIGLALINFSGAAIYAARIPKRWYPKTFDLIGQSHNLMHLLVILGAVVRLRGLLGRLHYWEVQALEQTICAS